MLELDPRTRTVLGIVLLVLGAALAGLQILGVVEVALVVAIPVAILLLASGTVLVGTSERGPGGRPV